MSNYASIREVYDRAPMEYRMENIIVSSLRFIDEPYNTRGVIKFFTPEPEVLFLKKWDNTKKAFEWYDAINHVFECNFRPTKTSKKTYVMLPGSYSKDKVWYDNIKLVDRMGVNRVNTLKALLIAIIEAKAGRFVYNPGSEKDFSHNFRKVKDDEETTSGYIGVSHELAAKLKEEWKKAEEAGEDTSGLTKVYTRPSVKSCTNCSNCVRFFESDDGSDSVLPTLPTRSVSDLSSYGNFGPSLACLNDLEAGLIDIDIVDKINELARIDRPTYVDRNGRRRKVGPKQVVISTFEYGSVDTVTKQYFVGEGDEAEVVKETVEEDYEGFHESAIDWDDLRTMMLETRAFDCPHWTKAESAIRYYEWAKYDKACVMGLIDGEWTKLTDATAIKRAGKDWKVRTRYHGIQATYQKVSPADVAMKNQRDFLDKFNAWVSCGSPDRPELIAELADGFATTQPMKAIKEEWLSAYNHFFKTVCESDDSGTLKEGSDINGKLLAAYSLLK